MPSEKNFNDYDWDAIATAMGGKVRSRGDRFVEIYVPPLPRGGTKYSDSLDLIISDNGGEVNVSKIVPALEESVPYWSNAHPGGAVGDLTLASRLNQALAGQRIDYDLDLDSEHAGPVDPRSLIPTRPLTDAERYLLADVESFGSEGYPVHGSGRRWTWGTADIPGPPTSFPTKREAVASFERYLEILMASAAAERA